jgi:hypothetical protein
MNEAIAEFEQAVAAKPPAAFYDTLRKEYMMQDKHGNWIGLTETQFKRVLRQHGISARNDEKHGISPQDTVLLHLQNDQNVMWSGSLAGYSTGFYEMGGTRVLVTTSPRILEPADGDWDMLRGIIEGVLADRGGEQVPYFLAWLKLGYEALRAGKIMPGQAVVLVGPHECGKSLLQHLVTVVLGGRSAKPYQVMSGGTAFNADLFGAEHLMVEDEQPSTDIRARRAFGAQIKSVTVNVDQRLHAKHRDALVLRPFWRLTVSLNDEPENVMVLPPMDDSLEDKVFLFKACRHVMPMSTATAAERAAFWEKIVSQVPAMLAELVKMEIPAEMRSERFGVKVYHNPEILRILDDLAPETRLLDLLDAVLFTESMLGALGGVAVKAKELHDGTAAEIEKLLTGSGGFEHEARRLLAWSGACGTYLARLAKQRPERVQQRRTADARLWRILPPPAATAERGMPPAAGGEGRAA